MAQTRCPTCGQDVIMGRKNAAALIREKLERIANSPSGASGGVRLKRTDAERIAELLEQEHR